MTALPDKPPSNPEAWLAEHGSKLLLLARQWARCHADAEDIVQEAWLRFWPSRHRARDPVAYLYRTVRNTAMNFARSRTRRVNHESVAREAASHDASREQMFKEPSAVLEKAELGVTVQQALESLPPEQSEVVVLRLWSQLTFDSIAEVLDCPTATAKSRYRYALKALRDLLAEEA